MARNMHRVCVQTLQKRYTHIWPSEINLRRTPWTVKKNETLILPYSGLSETNLRQRVVHVPSSEVFLRQDHFCTVDRRKTIPKGVVKAPRWKIFSDSTGLTIIWARFFVCEFVPVGNLVPTSLRWACAVVHVLIIFGPSEFLFRRPSSLTYFFDAIWATHLCFSLHHVANYDFCS